MYVSTYTQISLANDGSLTGSNCLSTISNQLLVNYKLFLGAAPRSPALTMTTEQRHCILLRKTKLIMTAANLEDVRIKIQGCCDIV